MKNESIIRDYMIHAFLGIFIGCLIGWFGEITDSVFPNTGLVVITAAISIFSAFYLWWYQ